VPDADRHAVMRALMGCPVHAIIEMTAGKSVEAPRPSPIADEASEPHPETEANEAEWGFVR